MTRVYNPRAVLALGLACGLMATAAGCGDDEESTSAGGSTTTEQRSFTGSPVKVYLQLPLKTQVADNTDAENKLRAKLEKINSAGGLNGREVQLETCNDTDANAELACVRKAVKDKAIAFLGSSFLFNFKAAQAALEKAKIPSIAPLAVNQGEYANAINFPVYTPVFGLLACPQQITEATGARKVSTVTQDLPVQKEIATTVQGVAGAMKIGYGRSVLVPQSQTDFSGPVKQLQDSGAEAIIDVLTPTTQPAFFTAINATGSSFKGYCATASIFDYATLRQLGDKAKDAYISSGLPPVNEESAGKYPLIKEFLEDGEGGELKSPENALNAWLGAEVLVKAAEGTTGELTGATVLKALNGLQVDLSGAGLPTLDFSKPIPAPTLARLFNPVVNLQKWDPGKQEFQATDVKPVNVMEVFGALQGAAK